MYTVGQLARICNVSAKTLRHYDEIGLLMLAGALDDTVKLAAILRERADAVRLEVDSRLELLSRIEKATAQLGREKERMSVEEQMVTLKDLPEVQVVGVRKTIPIGEIGSLFGLAARQMRSRPAGPPMTLYYD